MKLIFDDCIVNLDTIISVYLSEGKLIFESDQSYVPIVGFDDNAMQQIAVGIANGDKYLEMSGKISVEKDNDESFDINV